MYNAGFPETVAAGREATWNRERGTNGRQGIKGEQGVAAEATEAPPQ